MAKCPRDGADLKTESHHDIEIDVCGTCKGGWYDFGELAALEATAARDAATLAGIIEYSKREDVLSCPTCDHTMVAFDYRGNSLELDACPDEHGFWLDAGESERVRELIKQRTIDLQRSASAEQKWKRSREAGFNEGVVSRIRNLFRRR